MPSMHLPVGAISDDFEKAKAYCNHFNCEIYPAKNGSNYNRIETDDAVNFFWLGRNMELKSTSSLTQSSAEKFLS